MSEFKNLHSNQKIVILEMLTRNIDVEIFDEKNEIIKASYNEHVEYLLDRDSSIMPYNMSIIAGNKFYTKRILQENNINVPVGKIFNVEDSNDIISYIDSLSYSVVIKPVFGSHGYDIFMDIKNKKDVLYALNIIKNHNGSCDILVEEFFDANEYRVFYTKNNDYAVLWRKPASIIGNGKDNILELIEKENYKRMNPRTNTMCEIYKDEIMDLYLSKNNISYNYIPDKNKEIQVRPNSNIALGGTPIDKTDEVHQSVLNICQNILKSFPGVPYLGIDFMTKDISKAQSFDDYRIIEVNTIPGVDMHFRPGIGKSRNIAKYIVDLIFPETKNLF